MTHYSPDFQRFADLSAPPCPETAQSHKHWQGSTEQQPFGVVDQRKILHIRVWPSSELCRGSVIQRGVRTVMFAISPRSDPIRRLARRQPNIARTGVRWRRDRRLGACRCALLRANGRQLFPNPKSSKLSVQRHLSNERYTADLKITIDNPNAPINTYGSFLGTTKIVISFLQYRCSGHRHTAHT
jgi:hypothetical protein